MNGLLWIVLLSALGPIASRPTPPSKAGVAPSAPAAPCVTLTPGVYPLSRAETGGGAGPALEPVPLPVTSVPPAVGDMPLIEPKYASEKVLYARLPLGDTGTGVLIALDESTGTGCGYDRLYADANLDGNLAVAPPIKGKLRRAGSLQNVDFDCPALPAAYQATESAAVDHRPVRVCLHGFRLGQSEWRWSVDLGEYRTGEIASSRGPLRITVADSAMQAVYNRRCIYHSALPTADGAGPQLWLSPDPTRAGSRAPLHLSLSAAQLLDGQLYRFEPAADGSAVSVAAYSGTSGRAHIDAANARRQAVALTGMTLQGDAGRFEIDRQAADLALPEGEYYTIASIRQPDRDGDWLLTFRSRGALRVPAAKETSVPVGGALKTVIAPGAARLAVRRGQEITVPLLFLTAAGHQLTAFESPRGSSSALVVVRTTAGHVIARGRSGFA